MEWALSVWSSGIDFDLPGNGGPDCLASSSSGERVKETALTFIFFCTAFLAGARYCNQQWGPTHQKRTWPAESSAWRQSLLWSMIFTWGAEVLYKLVTSQLIFVVNPCHLLCLIQAYLLSDYDLGLVDKNTVFRVHLFYLHGPLMACIFPVTNTLFLPGEVLTYWVEHALLLVIPFYLLCSKHTPYTVPTSSGDILSWTSLSYGVWGVYHYFFLQPLALISLANLNSVLCPAITDPFRGPSYRLHALWHQALATLVSGSFWCSLPPTTKPKEA